MRVLFLPGWYPNRVHPNLGNFVQRHADAVSTMHEVTVVHAAHDPSVRHTEVVTVRRGAVTEHIAYYRPGAVPVVDRWRAWQLVVDRFGRDLDLVHAHVLHATVLPLRQLRRSARNGTVITEHWTGYHNGEVRRLPLPIRWMMRKEALRAARICPVSDHLGDAMCRAGLKGRYTTVPNVVDTNLFRPNTGKGDPHPFRFLHVSTLVDDHKNVSGLLRAFRKALDRDPGLFLEILGDGDLRPHQATATALGIPTRAISFTGDSPLATVAERMRAAGAFVLFSRRENMPCVILEAFASGTPVISTDVGGIPEEVNTDRGILVASEDEDALTEALLRMATSADAFDRQALRRYAEEHSSVAQVARAYDTIYRETREGK
ncbi:MAG TPA: glycosyltransferase [Flavobacteriales bacterium]